MKKITSICLALFSLTANAADQRDVIIGIQQAEISALRHSISELRQTLDKVDSRAKQLEEGVSGLDGRATKLETGVSNLASSKSALSGDIQVDGKKVIDKDGGWHRTYGNTGWSNETYGGGWLMQDPTWIRTFGNKSVYSDSVIRADGGFQVDGKSVIDAGAGWHRTYGDTGWYNGTYGGGWHMIDSTWIRSFNGKNVYSDAVIRADGGFQVDGQQVIDADAGWHRTYGNTGWYNGTYGGGWNMSDSTWIRSYGGKNVYSDAIIRADGGFQVAGKTVIDSAGNLATTVRWKGGNNGTVNCNTFCSGAQWAGWKGACLTGMRADGNATFTCDQRPGPDVNTQCLCAVLP